MTTRLDTQITQESLERNFLTLNRVLSLNESNLSDLHVLLTEEQKQRIAAIAAAVERANDFTEDRVRRINNHVNELITIQQKLAEELDIEIRETITAVESGINAVIEEVKNVDIPNIQNNINDAVEALDQAKVSHVLFDSTVNELVQADSDSRSLITQNAESITSVVGNLNKAPGAVGQYTAISSLKQQADGITSTVSANKTDTDGKLQQQASQITQNADNISSVVTNLNTDPFTNTTQPYTSFTKIKQTTDAITSTVSANKQNADGKISTLNTQLGLVSGQITAAVTAVEGELTTKISAVEVDVDGIHQTVVANKADADGKITQQGTRIDQLPGVINLAVTQTPATSTVPNLANLRLSIEGLNSTVSNQAGEISALEQRAGSIEATVATKASAASLQVTNSSVSAIVTNLNKAPGASGQYSAITALKGQVDLCVKDEDLTGASVVSRINLSPDGVKIAGKMIEVDGNTVFKGNVDITGKLTASNLGALTGGVIGTLRTASTGARTEITDNLIRVYDADNNIRVRLGVWNE